MKKQIDYMKYGFTVDDVLTLAMLKNLKVLGVE